MLASFRIFSRSPQRNVWSLETQPFWAKCAKRNEKKNLLCFKIRSVYSVIFKAVPWFWLNNWRRVTLYYFIPRTLQRVLWHWKVSKQRKTLTTLCDFTIGNFGLPWTNLREKDDSTKSHQKRQEEGFMTGTMSLQTSGFVHRWQPSEISEMRSFLLGAFVKIDIDQSIIHFWFIAYISMIWEIMTMQYIWNKNSFMRLLKKWFLIQMVD